MPPPSFSIKASLASSVALPQRAQLIAWRKDMETRELAPATIRCKLAAISSLFDYLCERNAVAGNPVG